MTLWNFFMCTEAIPVGTIWKIFDTNKNLLCKDYGTLKNDIKDFDDLMVLEMSVEYENNNILYVKVTVE